MPNPERKHREEVARIVYPIMYSHPELPVFTKEVMHWVETGLETDPMLDLTACNELAQALADRDARIGELPKILHGTDQTGEGESHCSVCGADMSDDESDAPHTPKQCFEYGLECGYINRDAEGQGLQMDELTEAQSRIGELEKCHGALDYILGEFARALRPNRGGQQVPNTSPWANARQLPSLAQQMRWCVRNYGGLVGVELEEE